MSILTSVRDNQARRRLLVASDPIHSLRITIVRLQVVVMDLWWRNGALQEIWPVYIPSDLSLGLVTCSETVPAPTIYAFTYYIFQ